MQFNLKFNLEKSIFGVDSITHVGFIVNSQGVEVDPQRLDSLREIEAPKSMKGLQSVLGVWNYIRNFIPHFSTRALPLTNMVGPKTKAKLFLWTEDCQKAFDDLKAATLDTKLLANIDYTKQIYIRCDSSQFGTGAVLFQFNELGQECPISYASRKYSMAERNYCTFQQEAAAVVWSLEKFSNFHGGNHVIVQSDHKNLSWIKRSAMPQLTRWRLRLQEFDFSLEYFAGNKNICADGLSRKSVDDKDVEISIRDFLPEHAAAQSILQGTIPTRCLNQYSKQRASKGSCGITAAERVWLSKPNACEQGAALSLASEITHEHEHDNEQAMTMQTAADDDEITFALDENGMAQTTSTAQFAPFAAQHAQEEAPQIPNLERELDEHERIIASVHNSTVGHNGVLVTLNRVLRAEKSWATRQEMISQIDQFISGCTTCQKFRKRHDRGSDQRFVIEGSPFAELSVDILKLPKRDCHGNLYVVVIVDSFSRWVSLEAVQDKSALAAARAILRTVGTFGVPLTIRSDGEKNS